jgi:hypothetical protein
MNRLVVGNLAHRPLRSLIVWRATHIAFIGAIPRALYAGLKAASKEALAYE